MTSRLQPISELGRANRRLFENISVLNNGETFLMFVYSLAAVEFKCLSPVPVRCMAQ